jgi:hypothetical protein
MSERSNKTDARDVRLSAPEKRPHHGKTNMTDEQALKLHYIDKAHVAWLEVGKTWNRTVIWCVLLSFLSLGFAFGIVRADEKFSLLGMELRFPPPLLPLACGCILTLLYARFWGLLSHRQKIENAIMRLYREAGFSDPTLEDTELSVLTVPDLPGTLASGQNLRLGWAAKPIGVLVVFAVVSLPLVAAAALGYAPFCSVGISWWIIVPLALMEILMVLYAVAGFRTADGGWGGHRTKAST